MGTPTGHHSSTQHERSLMSQDKRLWMPFPNDFWQHPKIAPLSDAAFRTFVEMNGYSRMQDLDGQIPAVYARKAWKPKAIEELTNNHPERPTLTLEGDVYVIWNYGQHQLTRDARARAAETDRSNGRLGGRPRKENPDVTHGVSVSEPRTNPDKSRGRDRDRVKDATPLKRGVDATPNVPWCIKHPGGTDKACGPCRTARMAFEASLITATAATTVKAVTATPKRYKPADGHPHRVSPGGTHCELCETRIT